MSDRNKITAALGDPNMAAFLAMIRAGEGTSDPDGYRRHFGGKLFDGWQDHPRVAITAGLGKNQYTSTAAGAYQFLSRTWDECAAAMGLPDFSPASQDKAAVFLIDRRRALDDVLAGRVEQAIAKCAREWASLPGSPYGQPTRSLDEALRTYADSGGTQRPQGEPAPIETITIAKEPAMPIAPFIAAALPSLIDAIPKLGALFGSGSAVAERNTKAAELAVEIVQTATGARNAQEATEIIKTDPAALAEANKAIESRWYELADAGGGGIEGARKADAERMEGSGYVRDVFKSHSFWIGLALLPLVYMIVLNIVGVLGSPLNDEVRSAIANGVIGMVLGGLIGYYFGQTTSRNRAPG